MDEFISRLITEKNQLDERINMLDVFLRSGVDIEDIQLALLNCQIGIMRSYSTCIKERLDRLEY